MGTLDPWGWISVYGRTSKWKKWGTRLYTGTMFFGVLLTTMLLLANSSGVDIVLNALAIMFLVDLDEQLLAVLLPPGTRAAIAREFREVRGGRWRAWKFAGMFGNDRD